MDRGGVFQWLPGLSLYFRSIETVFCAISLQRHPAFFFVVFSTSNDQIREAIRPATCARLKMINIQHFVAGRALAPVNTLMVDDGNAGCFRSRINLELKVRRLNVGNLTLQNDGEWMATKNGGFASFQKQIGAAQCRRR